jgi:hypothetical protein
VPGQEIELVGDHALEGFAQHQLEMPDRVGRELGQGDRGEVAPRLIGRGHLVVRAERDERRAADPAGSSSRTISHQPQSDSSWNRVADRG